MKGDIDLAPEEYGCCGRWEVGGGAVGGRGGEGRMGFLGRESTQRRLGGLKLPGYLGNYKWVISLVTAEDGGEGSGGRGGMHCSGV